MVALCDGWWCLGLFLPFFRCVGKGGVELPVVLHALQGLSCGVLVAFFLAVAAAEPAGDAFDEYL